MRSLAYLLVTILVTMSALSGALAYEGPMLSAIEKIAVFPVSRPDHDASETLREETQIANSLDDAWWQVREELTDTGRFLVASKSFMQRADAFQPRGDLSTGDAVILGRYVEADALITFKLVRRTLVMSVWETQNGSVLWRQEVELHPSVLIRDQIAKIARALTKEFLADIPYQGTAMVDALSRHTVFDDGGAKLVRVKVGTNLKLEVGDEAQVIEIRRSGLGPLFQVQAFDSDQSAGQGEGSIASKSVAPNAIQKVLALGKVRAIEKEGVVIELSRVSAVGSKAIPAGSLVLFPAEIDRAKARVTKKSVVSQLALQVLDPSQKASEESGKKETKPLATTLSIIASLAALLLLAF